MRTAPVLLAAALLLAGCGDATLAPGDGPSGRAASSSPAAQPVERPTAIPAADGPVRTRYPVTVLEADDGPQLCLGAIAESYPPQCGGPVITNWDWSEHDGRYERASGVRWGSFVLTGTFDGQMFTVSEVGAGADFEYDDEPLLGTPCPEPADGWGVLDAATTTEATFQRAMTVARHLDGYAASWVDQSINPAYPFSGADGEMAANDPTEEVVNVAVTGDVAVAEARLREVWGGSLCVSQHRHTAGQLRRIQREVNALPGMLTSGSGDGRDHVTLDVVHDDGSIQAWCDQTFGEGVVDVSSALAPLPASG